MQTDRATIALGGFHAAHNVFKGNGSVVQRQRVAAGYDGFVSHSDNSVRRQAAVTPEKDDFARFKLLSVAPLHRDQIAGKDDREHAGPSDFQLHFPVFLRDIGDKFATR
jgi:hypothetical protein